MGSEAELKSVENLQRRRFKFAAYLVPCLVIATYTVMSNTHRLDQSDERVELNLTKFRNCTVSFQPPQAQSEWKTKPIWLSYFPTSLRVSTHQSMIKQLTGLSQGDKSFYTSSRGTLKHCSGTTETATCSNVHPLVDMGENLNKRLDNFYSEYIMAIRNPMTALPSYTNEKQIKYHGETGQMSEESWRNMRDTYMSVLIEDWTAFFRAWIKDSDYNTGMYLVYEDLHNVDKGPKAVKRLRDILHAAGFVVAPEVDVPCIWFNAIGEDQIQQNHETKYEYNDYIPGYTKAQKQLLLTALSTLVDEYGDDNELKSILESYTNTIKQEIRIDEV